MKAELAFDTSSMSTFLSLKPEPNIRHQQELPCP